MKKTVILSIISGIISFGGICAMGRQRLDAMPEQISVKQARREEEMRRRERQAEQDREWDRAWERMNRDYEHEQYLENAAEGVGGAYEEQ